MWALTQFIGPDKIEHFLIFTTVSFLAACFALFMSPTSNAFVRIMTTNASLSLVGIIEEYRQYFDPHHTPELLDAISDICGVLVGSSPIIVIFFVWRLFHRREHATISATPVFLIGLVTAGGLLYGLSFISQTPLDVNKITISPSLESDHTSSLQNGKAGATKSGTLNPNANNNVATNSPSDIQSSTQTGALSKLDEIIKMAEENDKRLTEDEHLQGTNNTITSDVIQKQSQETTNSDNTNSQEKGVINTNPSSEVQNSQPASTSAHSSPNLSAVAIVNQHKPLFQALERKTKDQVTTLFNKAMTDYEAKKQSANKLALFILFNKYKDAAKKLENETDQNFQKLYANLESDLKDHGYDPSSAKSIKTQFNQQKASTQKAILQKTLDVFLGQPLTHSAD